MTDLRVLADALERYLTRNVGGMYDETLNVVVGRVHAVGYLTKADIGSLVLWKRISAQTRWASELGLTADARVREVTSKAYELANDQSLSTPEAGQQARWLLNALPGMSSTSEGALASAVLVACAPGRMAVWDRRVKQALALPAVGMPVGTGDRYYGRYLEKVGELAAALEQELGRTISSRDVDLALWELGAFR